MSNPYKELPPQNFWKTAVASNHWSQIPELYQKKFRIDAKTKIATAGSCFAQHIATYLRKNGYEVLDGEPAPWGLSEPKKFGYGLYSARYGNIYVVRHLLQLLKEAWGENVNLDPVWESGGRFYDSMRPTVEPEGLDSAEEVSAHRAQHLEKVRQIIVDANVLIFTFGLTEAWINKASGQVYPLCPGTVVGTFDETKYQFKNFSFNEIFKDFRAVRDFIKARNPSIRFLLTVSPVPLTATATKKNVLLATMYSKSVLRSVAGQLADMYPDVDYFPSYEIIASPWGGGYFYERNLREVNAQGVETVMRTFFAVHGTQTSVRRPDRPKQKSKEDVVCDELLLEAFAKK